MGRQSGHWAVAATIPFAAAVVSLILSTSDFSISAEGRFSPISHTLMPNSQFIQQRWPNNSGSVFEQFAASETTSEVNSVLVLSVPAKSVLVVGSLDLSGAPHRIVLDSSRATSPASDLDCLSAQSSADCVRFSARDLKGASFVGRSPNSQSKPQHADRDSESPENSIAVEMATSDTRFTRRFLIPHFEQTRNIEQISEGILVAQSARVSVFLDQSLCDATESPHSASRFSFHHDACELCRRFEHHVLDYVVSWIGPVSDLDGDGKLTIIITDLDRRTSAADPPVLGCVRDRDFLNVHDSDLSGDILYLDQRLPSGRSLDALLTHEITHAAVFSLMLEARMGIDPPSMPQFPSWLNESIAHLVEGSVAEVSIGFAERIEQFHEDTASSPIVASESYLPITVRRGGSRAAGTLFLQHLHPTPATLRSVIQSQDQIERRMELLTQGSFGEDFRTWSVRQSERAGGIENRRTLTPGNRVSERLFGTAFCCFYCDEPIQNLRITSDANAALQITVIESP